MGKNQDKILAIVCVMLLIISVGYFYLTTSPEEETDMILSATIEYAEGSIKFRNATYLHNLITDDDKTNDPYILSIRNAEDYADLGHIPGAVNIPPPIYNVFDKENLKDLPKDKKIIVYCYTGHTASQITALLNVNGYDAWSLKWGMCSWTNDSTIAKSKYFTEGEGYSTVSGTDPGVVEPEVSFDDFAPQASIRSIPVKKEALQALGDSCSDPVTPPPKSDTDTTEATDSEVEALRIASYDALTKKPVMKAGDLWELLYNDTLASNDPFILDLRVQQKDKPDYYETGHIASAVNIGIGNLFTDEGLEKLPEDKNKQIVVVCYTGHTASQATALLNLNGYNATALMWGMCGWSTDSDVIGSSCFDIAVHSNNYDCAEGAYDEDMRTIIYDSLNPMESKPVAITAETLYNRINDTDTSNDPFILSIRNEENYTSVGHISGAVWLGGITSLFTKENLAKLPFDKQIVVVCYTGHTASQAAALLNALGFNATALKWGMCSWNADVTAGKCYDATAALKDYPYVTGS